MMNSAHTRPMLIPNKVADVWLTELQGAQATLNAKHVPTIADTPDDEAHGQSRIDRMLASLLAHGAEDDINVLGMRADRPGRACAIAHFNPDEDQDQLAETLGCFVKGNEPPLTDLALAVPVRGDHVVALYLHRKKNGKVIFQYYDPSPSAEERERLREQLCRRLKQYDIVRQDHFTGVRQGMDVHDVNNSALYAVMALREMHAGRSELMVTFQEVLAWKHRAEAVEGAAFQRKKEAEQFMQAIAQRSEPGGKLAKRFAEHCWAIQFVFNYLPPREAARLQGLNKRLYHQVAPQVMRQVSFKDYPVAERLSLREVFSPGSELLARLSVSPQAYPAYLGWLLVCGTPFHCQTDRKRMTELLEKMLVRFLEIRKLPEKKHLVELCEWLGTTVIGHDATLSLNASGPSDAKGSGGSHDAAATTSASVIDLFRGGNPISKTLLPAIEERLRQAVSDQTLSASSAAVTLTNLRPLADYLQKRDLFVDVVVLPMTQAGGEKREGGQRYVRVTATPSVRNANLSGSILYESVDHLLHQANDHAGSRVVHKRLSDKLREDIRNHFKKMGWQDRLGPTFEPPLPMPAAEPGDRLHALLTSIGMLSQSLQIARRTGGTWSDIEEARLAMEGACQETGRLLRDLLPRLNVQTFASQLVRCDVLNDMAISRLALSVCDAIRQIMASRSVLPAELREYRAMLNRCMEAMMAKVLPGKIKLTDCAAEIYQAMNELGATLEHLDERMAMALSDATETAGE